MLDENWTTVLIAADEVDANLKKGFLENAGIECEILPNTVQPYPALSRFELKVPKEKLREAQEFLRALES